MPRMTATEFLLSAGWMDCGAASGGLGDPEPRLWALPEWEDNRHTSAHQALAIQRARDAAEERAAWIAFMVAEVTAPVGKQTPNAETMMGWYRQEFAVEIVDEAT